MRWTWWLCGWLGLGFICSSVHAGEWRFDAGPAVRLGMDMRITGSTFSQQDPSALDKFIRSPGTFGSRAGVSPGDGSALADRTFDDGFVFIDPSTIDYGGDTWYWGYQDASQYDAAANTLTFTLRQELGSTGTSSEQTTVNTVRDGQLDLHDELNGLGIALSVERDLIVHEYDRLSIAAGVVGLWGLESKMEASTLEASVQGSQETSTTAQSGQYVYVYDLLGVVPPSAPYAGTYDGPGPLIPNRPSSVEFVDSSSTQTSRERSTSYRLSNQSSFEVEAAIYECWVGPRVALQAGSTVEILFTPYVSLNLVDGQMEQTERLDAIHANGTVETLDTWTHHDSEQDLLVGFGAQGGLRWKPAERWFLAASGGYEWVPKEFEVDAGANRFTLDISGFQATLEIGWML